MLLLPGLDDSIRASLIQAVAREQAKCCAAPWDIHGHCSALMPVSESPRPLAPHTLSIRHRAGAHPLSEDFANKAASPIGCPSGGAPGDGDLQTGFWVAAYCRVALRIKLCMANAFSKEVDIFIFPIDRHILHLTISAR
ncbi:unnamed protein product [Boreogadus saida]